jgi:hypothetical protein
MRPNQYPNIVRLDLELDSIQLDVLRLETELEALKAKQRSILAKRAKQLEFNEALEGVSK